MKSSNLKSKMTILATTLVASSLMACVGSGEDSKTDLSDLRRQCSEQSGFTGNANFYPGGVFVWRADDAEVAECSIHNSHVHLVGILGSGSHPGDS